MPSAWKVVGDQLQSIDSGRHGFIQYRMGAEAASKHGIFAYRDVEDAVERWSRARRRHPEPPPRIIELEYDEGDMRPWPDPSLTFPVFPPEKPSMTVLIYRCTVAGEVPAAEAETIASGLQC